MLKFTSKYLPVALFIISYLILCWMFLNGGAFINIFSEIAIIPMFLLAASLSKILAMKNKYLKAGLLILAGISVCVICRAFYLGLTGQGLCAPFSSQPPLSCVGTPGSWEGIISPVYIPILQIGFTGASLLPTIGLATFIGGLVSAVFLSRTRHNSPAH